MFGIKFYAIRSLGTAYWAIRKLLSIERMNKDRELECYSLGTRPGRLNSIFLIFFRGKPTGLHIREVTSVDRNKRFYVCAFKYTEKLRRPWYFPFPQARILGESSLSKEEALECVEEWHSKGLIDKGTIDVKG